MNLNHLAISLIELNPENLSELDRFKKNLVLSKGKARGHLKDVLGKACAEVEAWSGQGPESRRAGIVRLGELLEQAMEFSEGNTSGASRKNLRPFRTEKWNRGILPYPRNLNADLLNEFIVEKHELLSWPSRPFWIGKRNRVTKNY